jgi:hypothetical protein
VLASWTKATWKRTRENLANQLRIYRAAASLGLVLVLAGCNGFKKANTKNFTTALNYYFSHNDDCLFPSAIHFPYEASTSTTDVNPRKKGLDALTAAGLLKSLEDRDIHVKRYEMTPYGSHVPPRFCYGHRVVTTIDNFTPPTVVNGQQTSQVDYHYKMMDVPGWADSDQIRKAFPTFAQETTGSPQGKTTLVLTVNGWRVPE